MLFNSLIFLAFFLPLVLAGFSVASRVGRRVAGCWLILTSIIFYGWERPDFTPVLIVSMIVNLLVIAVMSKFDTRPKFRSWILCFGVSGNIVTLLYFKYLYTALMSLVGIGVIHGPIARIELPLGISFFTFTQIGYLIDYHVGVTKDRSPLNYLLFVSFFPHLIAGPILHNREIMPQFADASTYTIRADNIAIGATIFTIGLAKKCLLADPLSATVIAGFADPGSLQLFSSWHVALSYTLQLYFDFSGYSDMAIGLARLFNIRFPLNFNSPYKAASIIDYWQRWHMTLTRYITSYIFNPVSLAIARYRMQRGIGSGRRDMATIGGFISILILPTFLTMSLAGAWHGAGSQFLIFGLLHASYLSVNHAWRFAQARRGIKTSRGTPKSLWGFAATHLSVVVSFMFFRANSTRGAFAILAGMLGLHGVELTPRSTTRLPNFIHSPMAIHSITDIVWLGALYAVIWIAPNTQEIMRLADPAIGNVEPGRWPRLQWRPTWPWALVGATTATLAILAIGGMSEFLYFQF